MLLVDLHAGTFDLSSVTCHRGPDDAVDLGLVNDTPAQATPTRRAGRK
jgi:hypothetical protein